MNESLYINEIVIKLPDGNSKKFHPKNLKLEMVFETGKIIQYAASICNGWFDGTIFYYIDKRKGSGWFAFDKDPLRESYIKQGYKTHSAELKSRVNVNSRRNNNVYRETFKAPTAIVTRHATYYG